jgi:type II secretory ATPase GspE/PulE/Tfp pilus assembly ATPase PilB-like protein
MQTTERLSRLTGVSVPERDGTVPVPTWCDQCNHTGYLGRTLVMETLLVDDGMKALIIADNVKEADLYSYARDQWFVSLYEDGLMAVIEWKTTMDEVRKIM